jgi:hypothetical protein
MESATRTVGRFLFTVENAGFASEWSQMFKVWADGQAPFYVEGITRTPDTWPLAPNVAFGYLIFVNSRPIMSGAIADLAIVDDGLGPRGMLLERRTVVTSYEALELLLGLAAAAGSRSVVAAQAYDAWDWRFWELNTSKSGLSLLPVARTVVALEPTATGRESRDNKPADARRTARDKGSIVREVWGRVRRN